MPSLVGATRMKARQYRKCREEKPNSISKYRYTRSTRYPALSTAGLTLTVPVRADILYACSRRLNPLNFARLTSIISGQSESVLKGGCKRHVSLQGSRVFFDFLTQIYFFEQRVADLHGHGWTDKCTKKDFEKTFPPIRNSTNWPIPQFWPFLVFGNFGPFSIFDLFAQGRKSTFHFVPHATYDACPG